MGLFDDALKNAIPDGNMAKPLMIAAGALLLGKIFAGRAAAPAPAPMPSGAPTGGGDGGLLGGLGGLLGRLQQSGHGDVAGSWVAQGPNQPIQPQQLNNALGQQTVSELAQQAGISEQDLLARLSQVLPGLVDHLTPQGRLPTQAEIWGQPGRS